MNVERVRGSTISSVVREVRIDGVLTVGEISVDAAVTGARVSITVEEAPGLSLSPGDQIVVEADGLTFTGYLRSVVFPENLGGPHRVTLVIDAT